MIQYPNKEYRMIRTAECVTPKHPDKMCDRIADAILTEAIKQDQNARTAIEVCAGHGSGMPWDG